MDYESILFGLQPLLNVSNIKELPIQDVYLESYLTVLDQLAVSLRSPHNRDIIGATGLLSNLLRVLVDILNVAFVENDERTAWLKLASELIRCLANSFVDNEDNRLIFLKDKTLKEKNEFMDYYAGRIFRMDDSSDDPMVATLQMRTVVLVKNLCIDNEAYTERFAKFVRNPVLSLLSNTQHTYLHDGDLAVLASELLTDLIEVYSDGLTLNDLLFYAQFIQRISKTIEDQKKQNVEGADDEEDDPSVEIMSCLAQSLETIAKKYDEKKDFYTEPHITSRIQNDLLNSLDNLNPKEFPSKLIIMRRITTSIGYISANIANSNKKEQDMCVYIILNSTSSYTLAAALIILSNSISSRADVDEITKKVPLQEFLRVPSYFTDPMQYQGYLDILRKLLNLDNGMTMSQDESANMVATLKICHDQSKYYKDLSPLVENLLKKILTILPSSSIQSLLSQKGSLLLQILKDRDSVLSCLALDKLLVARSQTPKDIMQTLWKSAFSFKDSTEATPLDGNTNVSVFYLFQLAKTSGIYLKQAASEGRQENELLTNFIEQLEALLKALWLLKGKTDRGSKSAFNNGQFVASMVLKNLENDEAATEKHASLKSISRSYFDQKQS